MTDNISREKVEAHLDISQNHEAGLIPVASQSLILALRDALDRAEAGVKVKALPRPKEDLRLGWKLDVDMLVEVGMEVQAEGWDTCLEVTELAMLAAERRILAALEPSDTTAHKDGWDAAIEAATGRHRAMIAELNFEALRGVMRTDEATHAKACAQVAKLYEATEQAIRALPYKPQEDVTDG